MRNDRSPAAGSPNLFKNFRSKRPPATKEAPADPPVDLERAEDRNETWQACLRYCRATSKPLSIPGRLIDGAEDLDDPEFCLAKGEVLVRCGHVGEGVRLLRLAPSLTARRRHAVDLTLRAAAQDPEFTALASAGDAARDGREWSAGEFDYWRALGLYPLHPGYRTQYAHCVKEQEKYAAAEISYRAALALGAPLDDVSEHLTFVAGRLGHSIAINEFTSRPGPESPLDEIPTKMDVEFAFTLLTDSGPSEAELLDMLRAQRTIRGVWLRIIADRRFSAANIGLLALLARSSRALRS